MELSCKRPSALRSSAVRRPLVEELPHAPEAQHESPESHHRTHDQPAWRAPEVTVGPVADTRPDGDREDSLQGPLVRGGSASRLIPDHACELPAVRTGAQRKPARRKTGGTIADTSPRLNAPAPRGEGRRGQRRWSCARPAGGGRGRRNLPRREKG